MIRLFISYSSNDSTFADRLASDLSTIGINVFYAKWEIKVGDSIVDKINEALASNDHLIIILSTNSVRSDWVKRESNSSLMRQLSQKEIMIKPVLIENCEIPPLLADLKYADFRVDYNYGFTELINSFQSEFELESFLQVVESVGKREKLTYDYRFLAILLKRLSSFSTVGIHILSFLSERKIVAKSDILNELGSDDLVRGQIDLVIEEKFVETIGKGDIKISPLGSQFLELLSEGVSQGIVNLICPH